MSCSTSWEYSVRRYFNYMYALMVIELDAPLTLNKAQLKSEVKKVYIKRCKEINKPYEEQELNELEKINMCKEYKPILLHDARYIDNREEFGYMVEKAKKLINKYLQ